MRIPRKVPQCFQRTLQAQSIAALAEMKEWKGVLGTMVTFSLAVDGSWAQIYRDRVRTSLEQATVAASTNSDHDALQLFSTPVCKPGEVGKCCCCGTPDHNGARTVAPNSLQNDPVLTKFSNLWQISDDDAWQRYFYGQSELRLAAPLRKLASCRLTLRCFASFPHLATPDSPLYAFKIDFEDVTHIEQISNRHSARLVKQARIQREGRNPCRA
jgi:hypothetical protein